MILHIRNMKWTPLLAPVSLLKSNQSPVPGDVFLVGTNCWANGGGTHSSPFDWSRQLSTTHTVVRDARLRGHESLETELGRGIRRFLAETLLSPESLFRRLSRFLLWRCAISLSLVTAALLAERFLQRFFPYPFLLLFFAAVIGSSWYGGILSGVLAAIMSILAVDYFFIPPLHSFVINAGAGTYCAAFIISALLASWVSAMQKQHKEALSEAHDQLEIRVAQRTADLQVSNAGLREREHQLQLSIEERENAERALMRAQSELAHLSRVLTVGELTSSIAHEVTQPLTAVVVHGEVCLECLSAEPPNLDEAREAAELIIENGTRAGAVLGRIRALFKKEPLAKDWLDMNELIRELTVFVRDEAIRQHISLCTDLAPDLPRTLGDRVQLQQVLLNLIMNGMDAMSQMTGRPKQLLIRSRKKSPVDILVAVEDSGIGLSREAAEKIFDPFFTTKPDGIGMGLSISRSIVESHRGQLWALPSPSGGATFEFTIPTEASNGDG